MITLERKDIQKDLLKEEIATPNWLSSRTHWYNSVASELTPETLANIILSVEQNDITDFLTLAEEMEERDLHYHSVLSTRKLAIDGLEIMIEAPTDDKKDVMIRDFIQEIITSGIFKNVILDLLDALGKGFAMSEIVWNTQGKTWFPDRIIRRDPRFFQFDKSTGLELRLKDEKNLVDGIAIAPYKFISHLPHIKSGLPIRGGLARLSVVSYMCKSYALKDWMSFAEVFGMPLRVGKYDTSATSTQKNALLNAVDRIGVDASCIIPDSMAIEFIEASKTGGGDQLFEGLANFFDSQVSKGVLGQTMTTDNGSSLSQAKVHNDVRRDILISDAKQLEFSLQKYFIEPLVSLNYSVEKFPEIRLMIDEPEDLVSLSKSLPAFIDRGLRVEESVIRDKFGLPEPAEGAKVLSGTSSNLSMIDRTVEKLSYKQQKEKLELALLNAVAKGERLTEDQRFILSQAKDDPDVNNPNGDEIDNLKTAALEGWEQVVDPILDPIFKAAEKSTSYEDMIKKLSTISKDMDPEKFIQSLATELFKARSLGNAKD